MLDEYSFENIYIRHALDECPDAASFTMHMHEQCEIYYMVSGNVEYLVEGSRYALENNTLMIMRPAEAHMPHILSSCTYERYAINFPLKLLSEIDPEARLTKAFTNRALGKNNRYDASLIDTARVRELCNQLFQPFADEYDRQLTIKMNIMMLLNMIYQAYDQQPLVTIASASIDEQILAYVNKHIYEALSVPALAKHFFISESHFNRIFHRATGTSPWDYITRKRLTAAKEIIHSGSTAQRAAEYCGFNDYSSFYRAYTKQYGCAPTE